MAIPIIPYPGTVLRSGSQGSSVAYVQQLLNEIGTVYTAVNRLSVDGRFGSNTNSAVLRFQKQFGLSADGAVGVNTWNRLNTVYAGLSATRVRVITPYPGTLIRQGARGDSVRFVQSYISAVGRQTGRWLPVTIDGIFGSGTQAAVRSFQAYAGLNPDGIVGSLTWSRMIPGFNATL